MADFLTRFAQVGAVELFPSGDYIARSNDVETAHRRVNPDDWDADGIPNGEDLQPTIYDGDFFGPRQELPEGANTNHYYWIDLVVGIANARVRFSGDGYSHLQDPDFIARAGETNRVMLLVGKPYVIDCAMPFGIVGLEDEEIAVSVSNGLVAVQWPLCLNYVPVGQAGPATLRGASGGGTTVSITPPRAAGGNFSWPNNFCCYSLAAGVVPVFDCDGTCGYGGCSTGEMTYEIGGRLFSYGGYHCGCHDEGEPTPEGGDEGDWEGEPPGPAVSVSFSKQAIIFEEEYANTTNSVPIPRRSTDSELTCEVYGGTNGGHYAFALYDDGRLSKISGSNLPRSGTVEAGETFRIKIKYEALAASIGVGDIRAVGTFTENETGRELVSETELTAVMVEVVAHATAMGNSCVNRHLFGPQEKLTLSTFPLSMGASLNVAGITNATSWCEFNVPPHHCDVQIQASCCGVTFPLDVTVENPTHLMATACRPASNNDWLDRAGSLPSPNELSVGMIVDLRLMPDYVSFENVFLQEGFCMPTNVTGFFEPYASELKPHDVGAGAWREVEVGELNCAGDDFASTVISITNLEWSTGGFGYRIPVKWYVKRDAIPVTINDFGFSPEIFELAPNGDFSVSKFGCTAVRDTNGVTTVTREQ